MSNILDQVLEYLKGPGLKPQPNNDGSGNPIPFNAAPQAPSGGPLIAPGPNLAPLLQSVDQALPGQPITAPQTQYVQPTPGYPRPGSDPMLGAINQMKMTTTVDPSVIAKANAMNGQVLGADTSTVPNVSPDPTVDNLVRKFFGDKATQWYQAMSGENAAHNPTAQNTANKDGSIDRGLMQINSNTFNDYMNRFPDQMKAAGITSYNDMFDPAKNLAMGKMIYDRNGWNAWYGSPEALKTGRPK